MFAPIDASAVSWNPFDSVDCKGATATSAICATKNPKSVTGSNGAIVTIANFMALIAGIAAVIILLIASIKYITADGDVKEIESAKNTIIYTVIGILVILFAKILVTYVVSKVG
jgi:hypothetical protein